MENENIKIKIEDLYLAQLRYYSESDNGVTIPDDKIYAILVNVNGNYQNVISPSDVPVYGRLPYSNTTLDGIDYGTKIYLLCGEVKNGLCYVLEPYSIKTVIPGRSEVTISEIEDAMLDSNLCFAEGPDILKNKKISLLKKLRLIKKIEKDSQMIDSFYEVCGYSRKNIKK